MSIVLVGACLGAILFALGLFGGNPFLTKIALMYLLVVCALFCVWRALVASAAANADTKADVEKENA
ncbi:MAG: hypothetical protein O3C57_05010 [Verrucomicrobia bacterium]|nr:hypothetical protein [Verrucomicrobiota bacterium]